MQYEACSIQVQITYTMSNKKNFIKKIDQGAVLMKGKAYLYQLIITNHKMT